MEEVMNIVVTMEEVMKKVVLKHCRPYETLNFPYACLSQADLQCCWNLEPCSPQYRRSAQDATLSVGVHFHFIYKDTKWQPKTCQEDVLTEKIEAIWPAWTRWRFNSSLLFIDRNRNEQLIDSAGISGDISMSNCLTRNK